MAKQKAEFLTSNFTSRFQRVRQQQRIFCDSGSPRFGHQLLIQRGQFQPVPFRQGHEVRIGGVLVARQNGQHGRLHVIGQESVTGEGAQHGERFPRVVKTGLIGGGHADAHKSGFGEGTGCPASGLQQPAEQGRIVGVIFPATAEQHVDVEQPAVHGKSSSIRLIFSVVMGGASGCASNNRVPSGPATSLARRETSVGWSRAVRKRTNSSFCSAGSASAAASISSSVLMRKVYRRCFSNSSGQRLKADITKK